MKLKKTLTLTLALTAAAAWADHRLGQPALADPSAPAGVETTDTSRVVDLDEVLVVAQPKEQLLLRRQPLSSTVMGADDMGRLGVRDLHDVAAYVPSFAMPAYGSRYTSSIYIRGIGSRVNAPAVGVYVDNIPVVSKSMFNTHIYGQERADVLRGPQGTLYGQNTEGGLLRLYTRSPLSHQGTDLHLSLGTNFTRTAELNHYGHTSEKLYYALSAFYNGQDGYVKNDATGDKADKADEAGSRLRLVWRPTSRLKADFMADYQHTRQNGFAYGLVDSEGRTGNTNTNRQGNYRRNQLTTGLSLSYLADKAELNYALSWQLLDDDMLMDIDYRPLDYMHLKQQQLSNAVTQELTLKSKNKGTWRWTTGAYFSHQWLKTDAPVFFDDEMNSYLSQTIQDYAYYGMLNSMAARMGLEQARTMIERAGGCHITMNIDPIPGLFHTPQTDFALFHESNIDIAPRLTATLGLRYDLSQASIDYDTSARMTLDESVMGVNVNAVVTSLLQHQEHSSYEQLLPKAALTYTIDQKGSNVYAVVSKGYRAGGYNIQMFSDILQTELQDKAQTARGDMELHHDAGFYSDILHTISYKPEESWNYELGTHLNLFGGKVHADLSAYYMQIRNQQLSVLAGNYGFGRMMVNAGKSYSCGVEAQLRGSLLDDRLQWGVGYALTRAVFKEYTDSTTNDAGETVALSYKDKRVPFIPMHTLSARADYSLPFSSGLLKELTIGANLTAQGSTYWDEANTSRQKFYAIGGAHADANLGAVTLSLWVRNITDKHYNTFAVESSMAGTVNQYAQLAPPRQAGVDLRIHF